MPALPLRGPGFLMVSSLEPLAQTRPHKKSPCVALAGIIRGD